MKDFGDKIPADLKSQMEDGIRKVRDVMGRDEVDAIKRETENLGQVIQKVGGSMYQQPDQAGPGTPPPPPPPGGGAGPEDVVDGEFKTT